jgi:hypothetical protein
MSDATSTTVSDELEHWLGSDQPKTLGNLIELFGPRSFALIFVLLMALPALPLSTGGATHVLGCAARRDRRGHDPRDREPRPRHGPAGALTPEVTPGPAAMQSCP